MNKTIKSMFEDGFESVHALGICGVNSFKFSKFDILAGGAFERFASYPISRFEREFSCVLYFS